MNKKNLRKMGSVLGLSQELPGNKKNDHFHLEISVLYESDINPELFERNQERSIFIFFSKKIHEINCATATKT